MNNNEAIGFSNLAANTVEANFSKESKIDLSDPLYYALKKCVRIIKLAVTELSEIDKDIEEAFKKKAKFDEKKADDNEYLKKVNADFILFLKTPDNVKVKTDFLNAEFKGELHKVTIEDIDSSKLPIRESEIFEKYLVK